MVFNLIFLGIILVLTLAGLGQRLFGAAINCVAVLVGAFLAFDFFEPVTAFISRAPGVYNEMVPYIRALSFMFLFLCGMVVVKFLLTKGFGKTWVPVHGAVDSLGGLGVGFLTGILTAGVLSLFYYMLPFNEYSFERNSPLRELVKPEEAIVATVAHVSRQTPGGRPLDAAAFLNRYRDVWASSGAEDDKKPKRRETTSPWEDAARRGSPGEGETP